MLSPGFPLICPIPELEGAQGDFSFAEFPGISSLYPPWELKFTQWWTEILVNRNKEVLISPTQTAAPPQHTAIPGICCVQYSLSTYPSVPIFGDVSLQGKRAALIDVMFSPRLLFTTKESSCFASVLLCHLIFLCRRWLGFHGNPSVYKNCVNNSLCTVRISYSGCPKGDFYKVTGTASTIPGCFNLALDTPSCSATLTGRNSSPEFHLNILSLGLEPFPLPCPHLPMEIIIKKMWHPCLFSSGVTLFRPSSQRFNLIKSGNNFSKLSALHNKSKYILYVEIS